MELVFIKNCRVALSRCDAKLNSGSNSNNNIQSSPLKKNIKSSTVQDECPADADSLEDDKSTVVKLRQPKRECVSKVKLTDDLEDDNSDKDPNHWEEDIDSDSADSDQEWKKKKNRSSSKKHRPSKSSLTPKRKKPRVSSTTKVEKVAENNDSVSSTSAHANHPSSDSCCSEVPKRGRPSKIYESQADVSSKPSNGSAAPTSMANPPPALTPASNQVARTGGQVGRPSGRGNPGPRGICAELVSSDMTPELMGAVSLSNNMNSRRDLELQTLYVKIDDASDGMNALLGWAVKDDQKLFFQCMFCPVVDTTAKGIAAHIRNAHHTLSFAMIKKVPQPSHMLFMHCRRCDYISVDITSVWIHYSIHHGLHGILSYSDVTDITPQPTTRRSVNAADIATIFPFFKCSLCEFLATDNRYVAQHAVQNHSLGDVSSNYNGCFVRVIKLGKPKQPIPEETYAEVAARLEGAGSVGVQSDTFVCVLCSYVSYCRYLAISHHMRVHTGKYLMYKCSYDLCRERCASSESMIQHLKSVHECGTVLYQRMCCQVTIVEKQGNALVEAFSL